MGTRLLGYGLIVVALFLAAAVFYRNSKQSEVPLVFSPQQMLNSTWNNYKQEYLEANTSRTLDKQRDNITTSEGESYTMLRAVWLGDKDTFDKSWLWTKNNLQHKSGDHLFSWLFGKQANGSYGILNQQGGSTTASDADTDIALSLIFAYSRWQDHQYLGDARDIINDIWAHDIVTVQGVPYMSADNLESASSTAVAVINPSYFNPAAYKLFALVDPAHPWNKVADSSYVLLQKSIAAPLDKQKSANLVPDWLQIDKKTGALSALPSNTNTTNFSFDALRTPYRLALDWQWFKDPRAKQTLALLSFLTDKWSGGSIGTAYTHDGATVTGAEAPAMYGGVIGYFIVADPTNAEEVYNTKLQYLYDPGQNAWKEKLSYYDDNWAWFGAALYNNLLPNLAEGVPASAFKQ